MLSVSQLFIYPIKSLGGIPLQHAMVTDRGFQHDRRWMLVDRNNCFFTQRDLPQMALLQVEVRSDGLKVYHKEKTHLQITIPFYPKLFEVAEVEIWEEKCQAQFVSKEADEWFTKMLSFNCRLIYMPDTTILPVDKKYASHNEITSLSDGYPFLLIGQSSLDELNAKLTDALPMNRFRPNIVFSGGEPYEEDCLEHFKINNIDFYGVKLCARCMIPTINQDNIQRSKEPLKTLANYRTRNNKIYFGQNLLHHGTGNISIGDALEVVKFNAMNALYFAEPKSI
ncbi:MAG: MOSC N-terminal beta barrel domain-containing protein [Ginsengibacter sp.]